MPVYNGAHVIVDSLESVLSQTHQEIEVLVVDDGSTDGTAEVVRRAVGSDPRVRILSQPNRGVARARNYGLEEANGAFVAFVDADDLWRQDKLAKQTASLQQAGPDVAVVYTWYAHIDQEGRVIPPIRPKPAYRGNVLVPLLLQNFIGNASTPLMRTSAVKRVGGYSVDLLKNSGGQGFEDWHLYLKLAISYDFEVVGEFLTGYRQSPGTMSRDIKPFLKNFREARRDIWSRCPDAPRKLHLWSEIYLMSWILGRAWAERRIALTMALAVRTVFRIVLRDPLIAFRSETRTFYRYVREMSSNQHESSPGGFLASELVPDLERWRRALELRNKLLGELNR